MAFSVDKVDIYQQHYAIFNALFDAFVSLLLVRSSNQIKQMALKYKVNMRPSWRKKEETERQFCRLHHPHQGQETGTLNMVSVFLRPNNL